MELEALPCTPRWNFNVTHLNGRLWLTGGEDENHRLNDCWVLKGSSWNHKGSGGGAGVSRWKSDASVGAVHKTGSVFCLPKFHSPLALSGEDGWRGPLTAPWAPRAQHQAACCSLLAQGRLLYSSFGCLSLIKICCHCMPLADEQRCEVVKS